MRKFFILSLFILATHSMAFDLSGLKQAGFSCVEGFVHKCVGVLPGMSKRTAIYIPWGIRQVKQVHLFFHGHAYQKVVYGLDEAINYDRDMLAFGFERFLPVYFPGIIIAPESTNLEATFNKEWVPAITFSRIWAQLGSMIGSLDKAELVLSGHSGAHDPIGRIIDQIENVQYNHPYKNVKRIYLYDSFFTELINYRLVKFAKMSSTNFVNAYYVEKSVTAEGIKHLQSLFDGIINNQFAINAYPSDPNYKGDATIKLLEILQNYEKSDGPMHATYSINHYKVCLDHLSEQFPIYPFSYSSYWW